MSILAADLLKDIFERAGVEINDSVKTLLQSKEISAVIPDELAAKVKTSLIAVQEARNNPEVRKHLKGEFLGGFDNKVKQYAKNTLGWSDSDWREFRGSEDSRSIQDYFDQFLSKVEEIGISKGEKIGGSNVEELRKKIQEDLNKQYGESLEKNKVTIRNYEEQLKTLSEEKTKAEQTWQERVTNQERDYFLNSMMGSLPFRKELADLGLLDDAKKKVIAAITSKAHLKKDGNDWVPYNPQDTAARLLRENKAITIAELIKEEAAQWLDTKSGGGTQTPQPPAGGGNGAPGGDPKKDNPFIFGNNRPSWT